MSGTLGFILGAASKGVQYGKNGKIKASKSALKGVKGKSGRGYAGLNKIFKNRVKYAKKEISGPCVIELFGGLGEATLFETIVESIKIIFS